jgi:ribosomal protein S18 acetylase RimI-like enzyme
MEPSYHQDSGPIVEVIFNFNDMTAQLTKQFTIVPADESDVDAIGKVHFQSICETYVNDSRGINLNWLQRRMKFLTDPEGNKYRLGTVHEARSQEDNTLYLVVKNEQGKVCGFLHVTRQPHKAKLEAIYLVAEARGQGVGQRLMNQALDFAGDLRLELEVLDYNQRARRLYESNSFIIEPNSEHFVRDKLPVVTMKRPAGKEKHEV